LTSAQGLPTPAAGTGTGAAKGAAIALDGSGDPPARAKRAGPEPEGGAFEAAKSVWRPQDEGASAAEATTGPSVTEPSVAEPVANEPRLKRHPGPPATPMRRSDEDVAELEVLDERLKALLPDLAGF